jgi:hypothetical protein
VIRFPGRVRQALWELARASVGSRRLSCGSRRLPCGFRVWRILGQTPGCDGGFRALEIRSFPCSGDMPLSNAPAFLSNVRFSGGEAVRLKPVVRPNKLSVTNRLRNYTLRIYAFAVEKDLRKSGWTPYRLSYEILIYFYFLKTSFPP